MRHRDEGASGRLRCDRCGEWKFDQDGFCLRCEGLESFDDGTSCCTGADFDNAQQDDTEMDGGSGLWGEEEVGLEQEEYESPAARRLSALGADSEDEEGFSEEEEEGEGGEEDLEVLEEDEVSFEDDEEGFESSDEEDAPSDDEPPPLKPSPHASPHLSFSPGAVGACDGATTLLGEEIHEGAVVAHAACACEGEGGCATCRADCRGGSRWGWGRGAGALLGGDYLLPRLWVQGWVRGVVREGGQERRSPGMRLEGEGVAARARGWRYPWQRSSRKGDEWEGAAGGKNVLEEDVFEEGVVPLGLGGRWRMGGMGLQRWRARRRRLAEARAEARGEGDPKKRYLFLSLVSVTLLFLLLFWRQLALHRWVAALVLGEGGLPGRGCKSAHRAKLSAGPWRYCGPSNGVDFSHDPIDVLDTVCAQHDFCIEHSQYWIAGRARRLYPVGETDEDDFLRCGIPKLSHMSPEYGCQINACDRELFLSLAGTFRCSDDPAMPKSPWCKDQRFLGKAMCLEWEKSPVTHIWCQAIGRVARAYHHWKVRSTCSLVAAQNLAEIETLLHQLDEDSPSPLSGGRLRAWGRLISQFWSTVWGAGEEGWGTNGTEGGRDIMWNCTCPGVGVKALGLG